MQVLMSRSLSIYDRSLLIYRSFFSSNTDSYVTCLAGQTPWRTDATGTRESARERERAREREHEREREGEER